MTADAKPSAPAPPHTIRDRLCRALAGEPINWPVYAVYDWFVENRPIDWPSLFAKGLGQVNHATVVEHERPNLEILETTRKEGDRVRRDVRWLTDAGELREWFLGEWRQEHLVKRPEDYRIVQRALEGTRTVSVADHYMRSEAELGDDGITLGQIGQLGSGRTPLFQVQIDLAGLERFSMDLADERPELMELLELMSELTLRECREAATGPAQHIKLWENLSIDTLGPRQYERHLVPLYRQILDILEPAGKQLHVHYDGKLRVIAEQLAGLGIYGIDSLTPPPEGDMTMAEGRAAWPDKFLWLHPSLGWFRESRASLTSRIADTVRCVGPRRFCFLISEDVPPNWEQGVPAILEELER